MRRGGAKRRGGADQENPPPAFGASTPVIKPPRLRLRRIHPSLSKEGSSGTGYGQPHRPLSALFVERNDPRESHREGDKGLALSPGVGLSRKREKRPHPDSPPQMRRGGAKRRGGADQENPPPAFGASTPVFKPPRLRLRRIHPSLSKEGSSGTGYGQPHRPLSALFVERNDPRESHREGTRAWPCLPVLA